MTNDCSTLYSYQLGRTGVARWGGAALTISIQDFQIPSLGQKNVHVTRILPRELMVPQITKGDGEMTKVGYQ